MTNTNLIKDHESHFKNHFKFIRFNIIYFKIFINHFLSKLKYNLMTIEEFNLPLSLY